MVLKEAHLSATLAWSPLSPLLAAGTSADSIDASFSSNPVLQVLAPDFTDGSKQLPVLGAPAQVQEPFYSLSWGALHNHKMGLIAGGLADGGVLLWDADRLTRGGAKGDAAHLSRLSKHTGAVKGVEFNPHSPHLLATGGVDGELCIWDVASPASPTLYPGLKGAGAGQGQQPEISALAWNKRVEWILATCSVNGTATVWDLKKQKPVITLRDTAGRMRRCSALAWTPDKATQLLVACAEDMSPTIQLWDLRNNSSPMKELLGHNKGVLSLSWSLQDTALLLSSGRDGRTLLWDVPTGSVSGELQAPQGFVTEVAWCPTVPGVFATASFGASQQNLVTVDNLASFTAPRTLESFDENFAAQSVTSEAPPPLQRVPVWMKRPISATFGFGGKLVEAINVKRQLVEGSPPVLSSEIRLAFVVTEPELVKKTAEFEEAVAQQDVSNLYRFCKTREEELQEVNKEDSETWSFLAVLFDPDARRALLRKLGFEDMMPLPERPSGSDLGVDSLTISGGTPREGAAATPRDSGNDADFFSKDEFDGGAAFFDELQPQSIPATPHKTPDTTPRPSHSAASEHIEEGEAGESERAILRALYAGNYAAAVDACLQGDRMADALVLGRMSGSTQLAQHAQREYMRRYPRPYMKIVNAVSESDFLSLVKSRPLDGWKETLAMLAAYTNTDEFCDLCNALARRLAGVGLGHQAALVYVCAGNLEKAVKHWVHTLHKSPSSPLGLEELMERAVIFNLGSPQQHAAAPTFSDLLNQYATILASQGQMPLALEFLDMVKGEASSSTAILKDRIVRSGAPGLDNCTAPFPFINEDVLSSALPPPAPAHVPAAAPAATRGATDYYSRNAYNIAGSYGNGYAATAQPAAPVPPSVPPPVYGATTGYGAPAAQGYASAQSQYSQNAGYGGGYGDGYAAYGSTHTTATAVPPPPQYVPLSGGGGSGTYNPQLQTQAVPPPPVVHQQQPPPPPPQAATAAPPAYGSAGFFTPAAPAGPPGPPVDAAVGGGVYMPSRPSSSHTQVPAQVQPAATFVPQQAAVPLPTPAPINAPPNQFGGKANAYGPAPTPFTPTAAGAAGASAPPTPTAPAGPPANISILNADVSEVPANLQGVVKAIRALFDTCAAAVASQPGKKREMEDNAKRLGNLFWKLNKNDVSPSVSNSLVQLATALNARDVAAATQVQVSLTATDWDECSTWLTALKRLLKTLQTLR